MLSLTTTLAGKQYEEELVPADQMLKMFGAPLDLNAKGKDAVFTLLPQHVKDDKVNGAVRFAKVRSMTPVIKGTYNGNEVVIRYYKSKTIGQHGQVTYFPAKVRHEGREMTMKLNQDKELIAFLALCGHCKDSPIRTNSTQYWELTDKAKKAQAELQKESLIATLIVTINNASERDLKQWAHSLELTGMGTDNQKYVKHGVRGVVGKTLDELKRDLVKVAKLLPEQFNQGIKDHDLMMKGLLREANDRGVIYQHNRGGGVIDWLWRQDIEDGTVICTSRPSQDAFTALYNHVLKPGVFDFFTQEVNKALGYADAKETVERMEPIKVEVATKGKVELKDMDNKDLIKLGLSEDKLYFDRVNMKVLLVKDGELDTNTLHKVKNAVAWQEELAEGMTKSAMKRNRLLANLK